MKRALLASIASAKRYETTLEADRGTTITADLWKPWSIWYDAHF